MGGKFIEEVSAPSAILAKSKFLKENPQYNFDSILVELDSEKNNLRKQYDYRVNNFGLKKSFDEFVADIKKAKNKKEVDKKIEEEKGRQMNFDF